MVARGSSTSHKDYSATPLWRKVGIRAGARVAIVGAPAGFRDLLAPLAEDVTVLARATKDLDVALVFATWWEELDRRFPSAAGAMRPDGRLWVAWPKKAANVPTDLSFDIVQGLGLTTGLVDNKTAAITDVFQGIQFVTRLRDRPRR